MDKEEFVRNKAKTTTKPLKMLCKMYLFVHGLSWIEITPDDPRRRTKEWEEWPGRCEICHDYEFKLQRKYQRLIRDAKEDEGIFCLSNGMKGNTELIEFARKHFGLRCVVCGLDYDRDYNRQVLGVNFAKGLEDDRRQAIKNRGPSLAEDELAAWERSKAWAIDLNQRLAAQGYTYDPTAVEFLAFGEDWSGCAATYPIHMGRAFGLTRPIERRFDLINPDCSPVLLRATAIEQNLAMPENICLFIFKSVEGRLLAQYWEGMHGIFDKPHVIKVNFPPASVRLIDAFGNPRGGRQTWGAEQTGLVADNQCYAEGLKRFNRHLIDAFGNPRGDRQGCSEALERFGRYLIDVFGNPRGGLNQGDITVGAGCGLHTPHQADLVLAEPNLSLGEFRQALLAGEVVDS